MGVAADDIESLLGVLFARVGIRTHRDGAEFDERHGRILVGRPSAPAGCCEQQPCRHPARHSCGETGAISQAAPLFPAHGGVPRYCRGRWGAFSPIIRRFARYLSVITTLMFFRPNRASAEAADRTARRFQGVERVIRWVVIPAFPRKRASSICGGWSARALVSTRRSDVRVGGRRLAPRRIV